MNGHNAQNSAGEEKVFDLVPASEMVSVPVWLMIQCVRMLSQDRVIRKLARAGHFGRHGVNVAPHAASERINASGVALTFKEWMLRHLESLVGVAVMTNHHKRVNFSLVLNGVTGDSGVSAPPHAGSGCDKGKECVICQDSALVRILNEYHVEKRAGHNGTTGASVPNLAMVAGILGREIVFSKQKPVKRARDKPQTKENVMITSVKVG